MSKIVAILKRKGDSTTYEKVHSISESILYFNKEKNVTVFKRYIELERLFTRDDKLSYKLGFVDNDEIELENFNRGLKGIKEIPSSPTFEIFIIKYVKNLAAQTLGSDASAKIRNMEDVLAVLPLIQYELNARNKTSTAKNS